MSRFRKNLIILMFLVLAGLALANFALAQDLDVGLEYGEQIGLSSEDPRIMAANVIRIALGFLGIIAVGLIIYAGWLYMTASGEEEKIAKAKKILTGAIIGLVIILSAFAIASFILNRLLTATTPGAGLGTGPGTGTGPGAGGGVGPGGGSDGAISCDSTAGPDTCEADATLCPEGFYCETESCTCQAGGGYGASCDSAPDSSTCEADNNLCSAYLTCNAGNCVCLGAPVIEWVSPVDGAKRNLVTIGGRYFGNTVGRVYFWDGSAYTMVADFPSSVNTNCNDSWQDNQIIVMVPNGAVTGPVKVMTSNAREDTTDNTRGPDLDDFVVNDVVRPGLCKIDPGEGTKDASITYYGLSLTGATAFYGNEKDKVRAQNSAFNTDMQGTAKVPDIQTGKTTTFVLNDGLASNYLDFTKVKEPDTGPRIDSFEPASGAPGQYVTIRGSGFGATQGKSEVYFGPPAEENKASYQFPTDCARSIWSDNQIIVKVPELTAYPVSSFITMEIVSGKKIYPMSSKGQFKVDNTLDLTPSLCGISPPMGPINSEVSLWGERFGDQAYCKVIFNPKKEQSCPAIASEGGADRITTTVPLDATTGNNQVRVVQDTLESNSMNFKVGPCAVDKDCGDSGVVCCPAGSSEEGRCKAGTDINVCYAGGSSVYEWEFSTGYGDEAGNIIITITDNESSETGGTAEFTVKLKKLPTADVTINLESDNEGEGKITAPTPDSTPDPDLAQLTFTPGDYDDAQTVIVTGQNDDKFDGATVYYINLKAISADANYNNKEKNEELINIDDEISGGVLVSKEDGETSESGKTETLKVKLYEAPEAGKDVFINFTSSNLLEGVIISSSTIALPSYDIAKTLGITVGPSTLAFSDSNYKIEQTIIVKGVDDSIIDPDTIYEIGLTVVSSSKNYKGMTPNSIELINLDNDPSVAIRPGERCVNVEKTACSTNFCGGDYSCLGSGAAGDCGTCCCDPTIPQTNASGLQCVADKSPCTGASRGLYCGCEEDKGCGSKETVGCASDTCCRAKPTVSSTYPADGDTGVCLNTLISATFSEKMDIASFSGNIVVAGEHEYNCPEGTQYLVLGDGMNKKRNVVISFYQKILSILAKAGRPLFGGKVLADKPDPKFNYCAVTGIVNGIDEADGTTKLTFSLNKPLDPNRKYYVIIKGDEDSDSSQGVLSNWKIGLNGPNEEKFSGQTFTRAKIWSFTTGVAAGNNDCKLSSVMIKPASYLFKKAGGKQDFQAEPRSANNQILVAIPGYYDWEWSWISDNNNVAGVNNTNSPIQTVTAGDVKDGKTFIRAKATITDDTIFKTFGEFEGEAEVFVFLCENPWPPIKDDGTWETWKDSSQGMDCLDDTGDCASTNYELYYCRDRGAAGSVDDLPAILSDDTIVRGASLMCVGDTGVCSSLGVACGSSGICQYDILKEAYFFREELPDIFGVNLVASTPPTGKEVTLGWGSIVPPSGKTLAGYKIYYGTASGDYDTNIDVGKVTSYSVDGLDNNQTYYFSIVAQYTSGANSSYSNEVSATPMDKLGPVAPEMTLEPRNGRVKVSWTSDPEATSFRIYYGVAEICNDSVNFGDNQSAKESPVTINLTNGVKYCFGLVAYDLVNNESEKAFGSAIPFAIPTKLFATARNGFVNLKWDEAAGADSYRVYRGLASRNYNNYFEVNIPNVDDMGSNNNGTTYYFAVKSVNADGVESAYSNEVTAVPFTAPASLSATAGNRRVDLIWTSADGASSYDVYKREATGTYFDFVAGGLTGLKHTVDSLTNGTTYYFAVKSVNADGVESDYSDEVPATPVAPAQ